MTLPTGARRRAVLLLTALLALLSFSVVGCQVATTLGLGLSATATPTSTATPTVTPTATATSTPTSTPTPTPEPLRLGVAFDPPQVTQGRTLVIDVQANRPITVTGALDENPLHFVSREGGAWAVTGVPVVARAGGHPIQLAIVDSLGARVSTTVSITVLAGDFGSEHIQVPPDRVGLLDPVVSAEDARRLDQAFADVTPRQLWQGVFTQPYVGPITSPFGMWRTYNDGHRSYHAGIDLGGVEGAPVVAAASGRVVLAAELKVHGNTVVVDHGWGVFSAYYHMSQILVQEGQDVAQGDKVGLVGNTGLSTGAHLHWDMRVDGVAVDPLEWTRRTIPH